MIGHQPKETANFSKKFPASPQESLYTPGKTSLFNRLKTHYLSWVIFIAFAGTAIYFPSINYKYSADDGMYTYYNNATKKGLNNVSDLFNFGSGNFLDIAPTNSGTYRPFTLFTFALEKQLAGDFKPDISHRINVVLYFFVLLIIGVTLVKLFRLKQVPVVVPLLILLLYAFHPLHVEVVASVKSRDTLLCSLFAFGSLLMWLSYSKNLNAIHQVITGILFFIALLSKEEAITFVAIVYIIAYIFLNETFISSLKHIVPFVIAAALYLLLRQMVLSAPSPTYNNILNNVIFGTSGTDRWATNLYIYLYYFRLLVFPHPLSWDYSIDHITAKSISDFRVIASMLFFFFLAFYAIKNSRKRTILPFIILFYLVTFSIYSNLFPAITIGSTIGERFMFIPSLAYCMAVVYGLYQLNKLFKKQVKASVLAVPVLLLTILFGLKTYAQSGVWKDNLTLGEAGIRNAPESWRTHVLYGDDLRLFATELLNDSAKNKKSKDRAMLLFKKATTEYERGLSILENRASIPTFVQGLADCFLFLGDTATAKKYLIKANENPHLFYPLSKLGVIAYTEKNYRRAIEYFNRALKANSPNLFTTYKNLGSSYLMLQDYPAALTSYEEAKKYGSDDDINNSISYLYARVGKEQKREPGNVNPVKAEDKKWIDQMNAGKGAYDKGDYRKAIKYFSGCEAYYRANGGIRTYPWYLNSWARSHLNLNEINKAKIIFSKVVDEDPENYYALHNLGYISFKNEKNYSAAEDYFRKCLRSYNPDYFLTYGNLGALYLILNKPDQAIEAFENALKYNSSKAIAGNLYLLWKAKANQEKIDYYLSIINKK
ncbi:MAG: tetratricopeptide repeat protein [Candidatus Dadabacteria bacterium]